MLTCSKVNVLHVRPKNEFLLVHLGAINILEQCSYFIELDNIVNLEM